MTYKDIANIIETDLKAALVSAGYVDSGKLKDSIKVTYTDNKLSIDALAYLKYLDDGKFYTEFMKNEMAKITPLIAKIVIEDIKKQIKL